MVTAVTAGVPWQLVRPMLRGDGRLLRLGYAVLDTHHLPWPGDPDREGRPGLTNALTYAPWSCPVDAYGCSAVASAAYFNMFSVS